MSTTTVWPRGDRDSERSVDELGVEVRDVLAGVDDGRVPELAQRWAQIEEFRHFTDVDADWMGSLIRDLVGLARRAREADQQLYCFMSL